MKAVKLIMRPCLWIVSYRVGSVWLPMVVRLTDIICPAPPGVPSNSKYPHCPPSMLQHFVDYDPRGRPGTSRPGEQVKNEGVQGLYAGLSAALARQASYTTLRLGLYDFMKRAVIDGEFSTFEHCYLSTCVGEAGVAIRDFPCSPVRRQISTRSLHNHEKPTVLHCDYCSPPVCLKRVV